MTWFKRDAHEIVPPSDHEVRTEGLWTKCPQCGKPIFNADLEANLQVCPYCSNHFKIGARERIEMLLDPGYEIVDGNLRSTDPLSFTDLKPYKVRLHQAQKKTGLNDAIVNAVGKINGLDVVVSAMEYSFIGGSMGAVVGETIARAVDRALETHTPLIIVSASGGARMMEGIASLMQLAKVSSGLARLDEAHIPYISLMTDPTTGGVTPASRCSATSTSLSPMPSSALQARASSSRRSARSSPRASSAPSSSSSTASSTPSSRAKSSRPISPTPFTG